MQKLVIYGTGPVAKFVLNTIYEINYPEFSDWEVIGFLEENKNVRNKTFCALPILGDHTWVKSNEEISVVVSLSDLNLKEEYVKKMVFLNPEINFPAIIHPSAWVSEGAEIGIGSIVYPGVCIDTDTTIGRFNFLDKNCTVGYNCITKDFITFSSGVHIGNTNTIERNCFWGTGSMSAESIRVQQNTIVTPGALVSNDLLQNQITKEIKENYGIISCFQFSILSRIPSIVL